MSNQLRLIVFCSAVLVQVAILAAIPARKAMIRSAGRTVVLKVRPVDPYRILTGYYVTLGYEITLPSSFPQAQALSEGQRCYAIIARDDEGVWKPISLEPVLPFAIPQDAVGIVGTYLGGRIRYGIEEFYIPETKRDTIAEDLRKNPDRATVEVKVDDRGNAALIRLKIEDRIYQ